MSGVIAALALLAAGLRAIAAARRRRRAGWPLGRALALVAGCAALAAALSPPLDRAADGSLTAHMAQHLLLGLAAPALIALAAPVRLALAALPAGGRRSVGRALHHPLVRVAARPAVAVPLAAAVTAGAHAPGAVDLALRHDAVHVLEHAALFWSGLLLWMSVLAVDPLPAAPGPVGRLAWLTLLMTAMSVVGAAYSSAGRVLVAAYAQRPGALADQQAAGALMWVGGAALLVPVILVVVLAALLREEERQRRREAAQAGGRG